VLVLFASTVCVGIWILIKSTQAAIRFYRTMKDPQLKSTSATRRGMRMQLDSLKRAGQ
jgi:hypothetical protein